MKAKSRFVWYELMTSDPQGAKAFYGEIVGWKTTESHMEGYSMWQAGNEMVGGVMKLPADAGGVPPNWLAYVAVEDVDAAARKVQELGGKVLHPAQDIPQVGRFAVVADPQGAAFALYRSSSNEDWAPPDLQAPGQFGWAELNTTDWESAWKFYSQLLGWQPTSSMDMGPEFGPYFMFGTDREQSMGGMSNAAKMMNAPPHWLHYVNVPSVDEAARRIEQLGGKIANGPMDIPGGDRVLQARDPQGAWFALYSPGKR